MNPIDYLRLLEPDYLPGVLGSESSSAHELYGDSSGMSYRLDIGHTRLSQEIVWVESDFLLLFGSKYQAPPAAQRQIVSDGDWIHVKFQVRGASEETLGDAPVIRSASGSCVVARYPAGSVIERTTQADPEWRSACLFFRPELVRSRLGASGAPPRGLGAILDGPDDPIISREFPIGTREALAINDLFTCPFRGPIRKSYMHAKAMELFTLSLHHVVEDGDARDRLLLTDDDHKRIARVRQILSDEIASQLTLEELARRVNLNRSKLAMGFKLVFGASLQAYWREMRLSRARELLAVDQWSVTDVAAAVGYAEISSLTRAFERRFGVLPKDCRARRSDLEPDEMLRTA